jgi:hypothetical protein
MKTHFIVEDKDAERYSSVAVGRREIPRIRERKI